MLEHNNNLINEARKSLNRHMETTWLAKYLANILDFNSIKTILDIGSRDAEQAIELSYLFPNARVIAIEPNPETAAACQANIDKSKRNIELVKKAIHIYDGATRFYRVTNGNEGASSLFISGIGWPQNELVVPCTTMQTLCKDLNIENIDLVWMDVQGAELLVLDSFGDKLKSVKVIYTEVETAPMYRPTNGMNIALAPTLDNYLLNAGFKQCGVRFSEISYEADIIYTKI